MRVLGISTVLEYTQCISNSLERREYYSCNIIHTKFSKHEGVFFPGHPAGNSKVSLYALNLVLGYISLLEYHGCTQRNTV
jgi:hypothetical protein